eukprot:m.129186 g.129186  ORF g.129186 m.129186 type:complete len:163 (+) comp29379_c0_seq4:444-932(+)
MSANPIHHYHGSCVCTKVTFEVAGDPLFTQDCHCNKCRAMAKKSRRPADHKGYSHTAAYMMKDFTITTGTADLEKLSIRSSFLYFCKHCGSLIYGLSQDVTQQTSTGLNVNNFTFEGDDIPPSFAPVRHVYYANRVVDVKDDLPKFEDCPIELGGSGKLCHE